MVFIGFILIFMNLAINIILKVTITAVVNRFLLVLNNNPTINGLLLPDEKLPSHIICSNARIETPNRRIVHVINFGPISVLPQYQRQGVGKALIHSMIDNARSLDYGAIMFFGRPEYYPQFGFIEAAKFGVTDSHGKNFAAFMAMELKEGYIANVRGVSTMNQIFMTIVEIVKL